MRRAVALVVAIMIVLAAIAARVCPVIRAATYPEDADPLLARYLDRSFDDCVAADARSRLEQSGQRSQSRMRHAKTE